MKGTKGAGPRRTGMLVVVWVLNMLLVVATFFSLFHWTAVTWVVGNSLLGIVSEILVIMCVLYLVASGFLLLGWQKRAYDSYTRLTAYDSYQCLLTVSLGVPLLLCSLFGTLACLVLVHSPATNYHLQKHTQAVFERADTNHDRFVDFLEFSNYQLDLPAYLHDNTTAFREQLALTFDDMDSNEDGFLTMDNLYAGVTRGMVVSRHWFGGAMVALVVITMAFSGIFWNWFCHYRSRDKVDGSSRIEAEQLLDRDRR